MGGRGEIKMKWVKEWPTEEGDYWFYGYRYGKISCGNKCSPELMFMKAKKIINGMMYIADGHFMFKSEPEEVHFQKAILPELPDLS